jgi:toxin ParE1/3/4
MLPSVISPQAEFDLLEIGDYIAQDNPRRAESFIDEILVHIEVIANNPLGYALRTELAPNLRSCAHRRYVIFFTVSATDVRIERVMHSSIDIQTSSF